MSESEILVTDDPVAELDPKHVVRTSRQIGRRNLMAMYAALAMGATATPGVSPMLFKAHPFSEQYDEYDGVPERGFHVKRPYVRPVKTPSPELESKAEAKRRRRAERNLKNAK